MKKVTECLFKNTCKDYNTEGCNPTCYPFRELYGKGLQPGLQLTSNFSQVLGKPVPSRTIQKRDFLDTGTTL